LIQYLRLLTFGVKVEFGEPRYRHSGFTLESDGQAKKIDSLKGLLMKIMISAVLLASLGQAMAVNAADGFNCRVSPKFSSRDSLAQAVSESLRQAKQKVSLALYGFNNKDLAEELVKLAKQGVVVRVKIDAEKGAGKKTGALIGRLKSGGVEVQIVAPGGRNHNKFVVIDGNRVLTGSYNWTAKAESNWENLLIVDCAELAKSYESEWEKIR